MRITSKLLIILLIPLAFVSLAVEPIQNGFNCDDASIREPFIELQISLKQLLSIAIFIPVLTIIFVELVANTANRLEIKSRIRYNIVVLHFGLLFNFLVVMLTKNIFGRLRPHAIQFCNASHYCPEGVQNKFIDSFECRNEEHPYLLRNARHSFYSGHASVGVYSGVFLILYLRTRLRPKSKFFRCLSIIIYTIIAMISLYPGFSQWFNYWHFASDVATGYAVGFISALLIFKLSNCDISSESVELGNNYQPLHKLLTANAIFIH